MIRIFANSDFQFVDGLMFMIVFVVIRALRIAEKAKEEKEKDKSKLFHFRLFLHNLEHEKK